MQCYFDGCSGGDLIRDSMLDKVDCMIWEGRVTYLDCIFQLEIMREVLLELVIRFEG